MSEKILSLENVGVKFNLGSRGFKNLLGRPRKEYWALKGVSFEIERGSTLGIIGKNGSGKTTLLRTVAEIYAPDEGKVVRKGTISTLLSLGAGFHNDLTGIDNIYMYGILLGYSRKAVEEKLDAIIEFADLREFINEPVRHYSSGMKARLGFSIATHLLRDIILIDEILSVGDAEFRKKSQAKMAELLEAGKHTIILVSHNIKYLASVSSQMLLLNKGRVVEYGEPEAVIAAYEAITSGR